jgi:hypothetical protein
MLNESNFNRYQPTSRATTTPLQCRNPSCFTPMMERNETSERIALWHYYDTIITLMTFTKVRLLWHIMAKARKSLLLHLWHDYYCHYYILNILWHLCVLWHHYLHYHILNYYYTYDIEVLLLPIMTIAKHYVHYIYIMTLLYPLLHFELLLHLWHWGTIICYYDNCKTLCALALLS